MTAKDATGNSLASGGATVTIVKQSGSGTIGSVTDNGNGTYTATVTAPTATGSGVFVATLGGSQVKSGTASQTQATVTYAAGPATKLAITTQPVGAASGALLASEPVVQVQDAQGNLVTGSSATVSVTSSAGSTIGGSQAAGLAASSGVASFTNLTLAGTQATNYTLTFASAGLTPATSNNLTVTVGAATKGVLTTQPSGAVNGVALSGARWSSSTTRAATRLSRRRRTWSPRSPRAAARSAARYGGHHASGVATFSNLIITGTAGSLHADLHAERADGGHLELLHADGRRGHQAGDHHPAGGRRQRRPARQRTGGAAARLRPRQRSSPAATSRSAMTSSGAAVLIGGTTTGLAATSGVASFTNLILTGTQRHQLHPDLHLRRPHSGATSSNLHPGGRRGHQGRAHHPARRRRERRRAERRRGGPAARFGRQQRHSAGVNVVATIASGSGTLSGTHDGGHHASGVATFSNLIITGTAGRLHADLHAERR